MQKNSTSQLKSSDIDSISSHPRKSTLSFLKGFARAYSLSAVTGVLILN